MTEAAYATLQDADIPKGTVEITWETETKAEKGQVWTVSVAPGQTASKLQHTLPINEKLQKYSNVKSLFKTKEEIIG